MPSIAPSTPPPRVSPIPRSFLGHGACTFLFDPAGDPKSEPAYWLADVCPFVLRIEGSTGTDWLPVLSSPDHLVAEVNRSEEHTSELQSLMRISYAVYCLKKKNTIHI